MQILVLLATNYTKDAGFQGFKEGNNNILEEDNRSIGAEGQVTGEDIGVKELLK